MFLRGITIDEINIMQVFGTLIAFLAAIAWTISIFPFTKAGRLMSVASMNIVRMGLGTLLVVAASFLLEPGMLPKIFSQDYLQGWLWLGSSGIIALSIGDFLTFRMYTILSPRYGSVLTTLSPASALLLGILLLDEHMNLAGILGIAITIFGVASMSLGRKERNNITDHGHGSILKGVIFGIIGALCTGGGLALSKKGFMLQAASGYPILPVTGAALRFIVATLLVFSAMILNRSLLLNIRNIQKQPRSAIAAAVTGTFFGPLLGVCLAMVCIQYIDVAVAQTIFALVPVFAILIAHFIYKEKITAPAMGGVITAIAGVTILIWRNEIAAMFS